MAGVVLSSFSLLFLLVLWTPPVQSYPDGGRVVCTNVTNSVFSKKQALLSGGKVFVKLSFDETLLKVVKNVTVEVKAVNIHCGNCPTPPFKQTYNVTNSSLIVTGNITLAHCESTQPNSGDQQPNSGDQQPNSGDQQPNSGDQQPNNGNQQPNSGDQQPNNGSQKRSAGGQQPSGNGQQPSGNGQQPSGNGQQPSGNGQQPSGNGQQPSGNGQQPSGNGQQPSGNGQQPSGNGQQPSGNGQQPSGNGQQPSSDNPPTTTTPKPAGNGDWDSEDAEPLYTEDSIGVYNITVIVTGEGQEALKSISITLKNPYGYLDAADYPAMVFYSIMLVVYVSLGVVWTVLLFCSYKDLIRLQFFIAVAILLGVLEKTFFVAEYAVVNERGESSKGYFPEYLVVAEGVSALKKTFARVLLIVVSLGYGTVIPRLGGMLKWLVLFGVVYFLAAFGEGLSRAFYYVTRDGIPPTVMGAFIPQLVMEVIFIYWIINAIVNTRRTLRLRRNIKKLAFYNHLLYTFVFAVIGITAFCLWFYISGFMDKKCEDLQSLWLKECFWHIIFTVLLVVIMILWRPSSNALRYAYSLVHDADEEEVEQKVNKNLETMSKRQRAKGDDVAPPRPSHDMEEDLKWVEENLPTSTIDQVLQPLVDSDEDELMTSRFELSKMD